MKSTSKSDNLGHLVNNYLVKELCYSHMSCSFLVLLSVMISIIYLTCISQSYGSNFLSPSFTTEDVTDYGNDFKAFPNSHGYQATNLTKCESVAKDLHLTNINSIKLISDGRFLNATVYLSSPFPYYPNSTIYRNDTTSLDIGFKSINSSATVSDLLQDTIDSHKNEVYFEPIANRTFVTKNNYDAYELIYKSIKEDDSYNTFPGVDTKNAVVGIKIGGRVLLIEFSTLPTLFSSYLDDYNTLLDSVKFSPTKQSDAYTGDNFTLYTNSEFHLSFLHPSNWKQQSSDSVTTLNNYTRIVSYKKSDIYSEIYGATENYYMLIDVHSAFDQGPDYGITYGWFTPDFGWAKYEAEMSTNGYYRGIYSKSDIFKNQSVAAWENLNHYLSMDFDLQKANFPKEYSVYIYKQNAFVIDGSTSCYVIDITGWIPVPPPAFFISASPNTLELRPNEEKNVKITIHNNSTFKANSTVYPTKDPELNMTLNPQVISLPPGGDSNLNLKTKNKSNNTNEILSHTISLTLNTSFPQNTAIIGQNITLANTEGVNTTQVYYYGVTTLPNLGLKDYLDHLAEWVSPLNSIWTFLVAIGVVLIPFLVRIYNKRRQTDSMTRADEKKKRDFKTRGAPF
jgi:hypothetical protein